jgi:hypothetical protein
MGAPPVSEGTVQLTARLVFPEVARRFLGIDGLPRGVAEIVAGSDIPRAFVAVTENIYGVPFVRPVKVY